MFPNSFLLSTAFLFAPMGLCGADQGSAVLNRIDAAAEKFHGMTAKVEHLTHTAVIDDDNTESGTVKLRKVAPGEVEGLLHFMAPEHRIILFKERKALVYTPASKTVQVYDLGSYAEQLDQFLMIGFGTRKAEIERGYKVEMKARETVSGQQTTRIELIPRTAEALKRLTRIELWITDEGDYPVQEKLYEPSGDYVKVFYRDVKINPVPALKDSDLQLSLPKDVQYVHPELKSSGDED